ncbi:MAG: hypothetical protein Q9226_006601 [Calogaya cf. arnoldii]
MASIWPYRALAVRIALLLLTLSDVSQTATVPTHTCRPSLGKSLYQSYRDCAARRPEYSIKNLSSNSVPNDDHLPRMPGEQFPYQMTRSALGVVFSDYEYTMPIQNDDVKALLWQAGEELENKLARTPSLETEPMRGEAVYIQGLDGLLLAIEPRIPYMTYGDQYALVAVLASWATRYESVECSFDIWAWPGMRQQKKLGKAIIISHA